MNTTHIKSTSPFPYGPATALQHRLATAAEWKQYLKAVDAAQWELDVKLTFSAAIDDRRDFLKTYGFVIYTREVVDALANNLADTSMVNVGCGKAYLSHLLQSRGVSVTSVDNRSTHYNVAVSDSPYADVVDADATQYDLTPFDVVIMTWPDYSSDFAASIVKNMRVGQALIYNGEGQSGCTADDEFFELVYDATRFEPLASVEESLNTNHVRFNSIHDAWSVWMKIS